MRASFPLTAERGRIRAAVVALCAMAAVAVAAGSPSAAHAAFALKACEGGPVQGEGSSFQRVAQAQFQLYFDSPFGCGEGAAITSPVTYVSDGSGCGIASVGGGGSSGECSDFKIEEEVVKKPGYRDHKTRFGGSDAPLTPEQKALAEDPTGSNPGVLHTLPIANGATAVIVHFPEGCELENPGSGASSLNENTTTGGPNDPGGKGGTGDLYKEGTLRVHIPAETLEKIWDGTSITWGQVLTAGGKIHMHNEGKEKPTAKLEEEEGITECKNVPVRRLVRFDGSGTTYNFKAYLGLLPGVTPVGIWTKSPVEGTGTTWPLTTSTTGVPPKVPAGEVCSLAVSGAARICTGSKNGNPFVANAVAATDGSIGYSDLATAREKGFTITKNPEAETKPEKDDYTYWIPLQTIDPEKPEGERVGANYVEPTATPASNIANGGPNGSNCTNADYRGIPTTPASDPTLGDWSKAIATGSTDTTTYPNCALTYDFAWDDDAPVYGNTPEEESKARTVKDYFTFIESEGGQQSLTAADYGALSPAIIAIGRKGVDAIGWDKAAGSGGGPKEEVKSPPSTGGGSGGSSTTSTVVTPPSNAFSIAGAKVKGKSVVLSLVLPGSGRVQIKATGGGITVSNVTASVGGGQGTVTLPISSAAQKKLAKVKGHKLSVKITVTFTPTGGTAASETKTITITQAAIATKKKKKGKKKG